MAQGTGQRRVYGCGRVKGGVLAILAVTLLLASTASVSGDAFNGASQRHFGGKHDILKISRDNKGRSLKQFAVQAPPPPPSPPKLPCSTLKCVDNYTDTCKLAPLCIYVNNEPQCYYTNNNASDGAPCKQGFPNYCKGGECLKAPCFPGAARLTIETGEQIALSSLQIGDKVATLDSITGRVKFTEVILFHHVVANAGDAPPSAMRRVTYATAAGGLIGELVLSPNHLIFVAPSATAAASKKAILSSSNTIVAEKVAEGDFIWVHGVEGGAEVAEVVDVVDDDDAATYFAPETMDGTLLVNGVLCSSYTGEAPSHEVAFAMFSPMRLLYRLCPSCFKGRRQASGVFWYDAVLLTIPAPITQFLADYFVSPFLLAPGRLQETVQSLRRGLVSSP